jgi:hypothetical protein
MSQQYPQQQYPQYGHHQPPRYAPPPRNGLGIAAMIVGLVALPFVLTGLTAWIAIIMGFIAALLALVGLGRRPRGMAITGLLAGLAAIVLGITSTAMTLNALDEVFNGPTEVQSTAVGKALEVDGLRLTVAQVQDRNESVTKKALTCATVIYENGGSSGATRNPFDWAMRDPAGASVGPWIYTDKGALESGPLAAGGKAEGVVCFERPSGGGAIYAIEYRVGLATNATAEWLWNRPS